MSGPVYKMSGIANQYKELEKVRNGTYPMSYETRKASEGRIMGELQRKINANVGAMGEDRFVRELQSGMQYGFGAGH
jgi:hypothetical protein